MQTSSSASIRLAALGATLLTLVAGPAAQAQGGSEPMALQTIMKQLDRDLQAVTGAIAVEDWPRVGELAPKIGRHAEPAPAEKLRILGWLGTEAGSFRGFDTQVHDAATGLAQAAARGDGAEVIAAFARVQQACLGCHQAFRQRFVAEFHGRR